MAAACSSATPEFDNSLPVIKPAETTELPNAPGAPVTVDANSQLLQPNSTDNVALNPPHGQPGHDCNVAVGSPLNRSTNSFNAPAPTPVMPVTINPLQNASSGGVRLNPPHGEPGHDCNVQVGQPLS